MTTLRTGRWTMAELADELGIQWRSAYRLVASLRSAGVTVECSREGVTAYYQVPAEPLMSRVHGRRETRPVTAAGATGIAI